MVNRRAFLFGSAMALGAASATRAVAATVAKNRLVALVISYSTNTLVVQTRTGKQVTVDLTEALANGHVGVVQPGVVVEFHGVYNQDGSFHCVSTSHSARVITDWEPDN